MAVRKVKGAPPRGFCPPEAEALLAKFIRVVGKSLLSVRLARYWEAASGETLGRGRHPSLRRMLSGMSEIGRWNLGVLMRYLPCQNPWLFLFSLASARDLDIPPPVIYAWLPEADFIDKLALLIVRGELTSSHLMRLFARELSLEGFFAPEDLVSGRRRFPPPGIARNAPVHPRMVWDPTKQRLVPA